jgi:hypothetical protein
LRGNNSIENKANLTNPTSSSSGLAFFSAENKRMGIEVRNDIYRAKKNKENPSTSKVLEILNGDETTNFVSEFPSVLKPRGFLGLSLSAHTSDDL